MAVVTVRAPGKVNRRIVGVTFSEGRAEVDTDTAAYQFFLRRGFAIEAEPVTDEGAQPEGVEGTEGDAGEEPDESDEHTEADEPDEAEPVTDVALERPHPVQGNKAVWFEYLSKLDPDHGFDLATAKRQELIDAVEAIEQD